MYSFGNNDNKYIFYILILQQCEGLPEKLSKLALNVSLLARSYYQPAVRYAITTASRGVGTIRDFPAQHTRAYLRI